MKTLGLSVFLFFLYSLGWAQCIVDLGDDIHVCQQLQDQSFPDAGLGDAIMITNGTPPYQYEWSITPIAGFFGDMFYASTFLDDTTSATPTVLGLVEDSLTFFLKIEDANEQVCYDTIIVSASIFYTHLGYATFTINAGDSVQLWGPNVGSSYPIDSVLWQPTTGLNDPNAIQPWASPETDQGYGSIVWDSQGCWQDGGPFMFVEVIPVGIEEPKTGSTFIYASETHIVVYRHAETHIVLINPAGKTVLDQQLTAGTSWIPTDGLSCGVYIYRLTGSTTDTESGKLWLR